MLDMRTSSMWVLIGGLVMGCTGSEDNTPVFRFDDGQLEATCIDQQTCGGRVFSYDDPQTLEGISLRFSLEADTAETLDELRAELSGGRVSLSRDRFQLEDSLTICTPDDWQVSLTGYKDGVLSGVASADIVVCTSQTEFPEEVYAQPVRVEFALAFDPADEL